MCKLGRYYYASDEMLMETWFLSHKHKQQISEENKAVNVTKIIGFS